MAADRDIRLTVDAEGPAATIHGRVTIDGGPPAEFFGWLELVDHIARATGHGGTGDATEGGGEQARRGSRWTSPS